jgi:hypothetical protein
VKYCEKCVMIIDMSCEKIISRFRGACSMKV